MQDFTTIPQANKRYEVTVKEVTGEAEQCGICDRWFEWSGKRLESFVCPVCNRTCCQSCSATADPCLHFPMRYVCEDCDEWSVEDQLRIAAFTATLNK